MPGRPTITVGQGLIALAVGAGGGCLDIFVGQELITLAVGAGGGCLDIFSLVNHFSFLSPSLGDGPI